MAKSIYNFNQGGTGGGIDYDKWLATQRDSTYFDRSAMGAFFKSQAEAAENAETMKTLQELIAQDSGGEEAVPKPEGGYDSDLAKKAALYYSAFGFAPKVAKRVLDPSLIGKKSPIFGLTKITGKEYGSPTSDYLARKVGKYATKKGALGTALKLGLKGATKLSPLGWALFAADLASMSGVLPDKYNPSAYLDKGIDYLLGGNEENLLAEAMKNEGQ